MCPACQYLVTCFKVTEPHQRLLRYAFESQRIESIGQMRVDYFVCEQCDTCMQRDGAGLGRRRKWRAA